MAATTWLGTIRGICAILLTLVSHHIPSRLYPPQQPIPHHRLHGVLEALVDSEQLARLHRTEAFGILLEQRHNAPAHVPPWRTRYEWRARSWETRNRGTA